MTDNETTSRGLFSSVGNFVESAVDKVENAVEFVDDAVDKVDDFIDEPIIIDVKGIQRAGRDCHQSARETTDLCESTISKAQEMVDFGLEIKATLTGFAGGMDASALATIKDLIDGDKMKAAMSLAGEMDDLALDCVNKSVHMIESMDRAVDALPDVVEGRIEDKIDAAASKGGKDGDPELPDIEPDVRELEGYAGAVRDVNLLTVFDAGMNALNGLTAKGAVCKEMFCAIKDFAGDIVDVSQAIRDFEVTKMLGKMRELAKDIWRCLRLCDLIKAFAIQVGKLIKWIVSLFRLASEKLSMIWGALAHAKDVLAEVVKYVLEAMGLCDDAKEKSTQLIETTREIKGHMGNVTSVNTSTISSLKDLMDGDEIKLAIDLATSMDDIILAAVKKIITMIGKVTDAFSNLPSVITEGISDMTEAGKDDSDPDPVDVDKDVEDLDKRRSAIEEASALGAVKASSDGFSGVEEKVSMTRDMIQQSRGFAESANKTIEMFMGVWDLNSATGHIIEMCRLVKLGEMLKQFADQIKKLVRGVVAVMEAAKKRIQSIDLVPDEVEDAIEAASKCLGCVVQ